MIALPLLLLRSSPEGLPALKGANSSFQFSVAGKYTWYSFESCMQVIYEDVEENRAKDGTYGIPLVTEYQPDVTSFLSYHSICDPSLIVLCFF